MNRNCKMLLAAAMAAAWLPACAPLIVGGIVAGTALVATDRRTTGTQVDDQTIQLRLSDELRTGLRGGPVRISVNSFERKVLLTGEVPNEKLKEDAGAIAQRSLNVRSVVNELTIAPPSSMGQRTNDVALGGRVRAAFVSTRDIAFNSVDIVTDRGIIYLMGLVTEREADVAASVASRVPVCKRWSRSSTTHQPEEVQRRRAVASRPPPPPAATPAPIVTPPVTTTPGTQPR
jgi:osmotically-inducible protein OsmY